MLKEWNLFNLMIKLHRIVGFSAFLALAALATPAHAYVGPGAGLTAIGSVLAVGAAVLLVIVGFVWYPIRRLMRSRKATKPEPGQVEQDERNRG